VISGMFCQVFSDRRITAEVNPPKVNSI